MLIRCWSRPSGKARGARRKSCGRTRNAPACGAFRGFSACRAPATSWSLTKCGAVSKSGATRCGRGRPCNLMVINAAGRGSCALWVYVNSDRSEATCRKLWGKDTRSLPHLQRLLEGLCLCLFRSAASECRQGDRRDRPHGALEQHPAPERVGRMIRKTLSFSKDATWLLRP